MTCVMLGASASMCEDTGYKKRIALLTKAGSRSELKQIDVKMSIYEDVKAACRLQLQMERVPTECFKQIDLEKRLKLLEGERLVKSKKVLSQICELQVTKMTDLKQMIKTVSELPVYEKCRKKLKGFIQQKEYQGIENEPFVLFESARDKTGSKIEL